MTQDELAAALETVNTGIGTVSTQLTKAQAEIVKDIADLIAAQGGNTSPTVDAAVAKLQSSVAALAPVAQALDDIVPG